MNLHAWRGRRVFLTGHTGFKGSWLSLWLQALGAEVTGYALAPPTRPSLFELARVGEGMRSVIADVRDTGSLVRAMRDVRPEVVLHMAAQPLVRASYRDPVETYSVNVMGTVHLLEAVRATPDVRAVVCVTSDKCYANRGATRPFRETDAMGGDDPYSSSKGCAELVCAAYRHSFLGATGAGGTPRVALATARAGNVIGGGDWAEERLVPDAIRAFERGQEVSVRRPDAVRPWQHVLEPLRGYLLLAERLLADGAAFSDGWNFGPLPEDARTVRWVVDQLASRWGDGAGWKGDPGPHPEEAGWLALDISRARARLGWEPRLSLPEALDLVVDWHRLHRQGADMRASTLAQIAGYSERECQA
jgi:CDP-glucose 4,6-dehydratase